MLKSSRRILQIGHPTLRTRASAIESRIIKTAEMKSLIDSMIQTLYTYKGVGLAAPQIAQLKRVIIIENSPGKSKRKRSKDFFPRSILINPEIVASSKEQDVDWEGCLSVDKGDLLGLVPRSKEVTVRALDQNGKKVTIKAVGFQARVLQHEIDHLEGILFFERMRKKDMASLTTRQYWEKIYNK